jgi:hypothetical protein
MTIELTKRQFELLLQLVYMGRYCYGIVEKPETMTAEQGELIHLVNKIYTIASQTDGLKHLVSDYPDGRMRGSIELEDRNAEFLDVATKNMALDYLADHLAKDEIERVYGDLPKDSLETYTRWSKLFEAAYDSIREDLEKNKFKNIRLHLP